MSRRSFVLFNSEGAAVLGVRGGPRGWELARQVGGALRYEPMRADNFVAAKLEAEAMLDHLHLRQIEGRLVS